MQYTPEQLQEQHYNEFIKTHYIYGLEIAGEYMYIGMTTNPKQREKAHRSKSSNQYVHKMIKEYNINQFEFVILKSVSGVIAAREHEIYYIKLHNPPCNLDHSDYELPELPANTPQAGNRLNSAKSGVSSRARERTELIDNYLKEQLHSPHEMYSDERFNVLIEKLTDSIYWSIHNNRQLEAVKETEQ